VGRRKAQYGPSSAAAERLLDDLDRLHPGAVAALAAAGGGTFGTAEDDPDVGARDELRGRLREIARRSGRLDAVRAIGDEIADWAASTSHWFPAGVAGAGESTREMGTRLAAAPIILDAAYAVVLEDQLARWELDLLLAPWEQVVGSPFEERADDDGVEDDLLDADDAPWDAPEGDADAEAEESRDRP
jgi:hypothetical protein